MSRLTVAPASATRSKIRFRLLRHTSRDVTTHSNATLLERERELRELGDALRAARRDQGRIVVVEGPAGIGKSTLLAALMADAAGMGFAAYRARASDLEVCVPYGCTRRLLEPALAGATGHERDPFEDAAAHARPLFAGGGPARPLPSADGGFAMLHGLHWLVNNLTRERPMLLCIDDLHWADAETVRFLGYLAPRLDGLPLAIVASVRGEASVPADMARLLAAPEATILRPGPLSVAATAALCERELGGPLAPDFAAACHGATGGNPFFLKTLLREARELRFLTDANQAAHVRRIGPAAVARAVLVRLAAAPTAATALVRAISVLGDTASVREAAWLSELDEDEAARAADLLIDLAIIGRAEGLEFVHPIVRSAIYEHIGAHERARMHARAARILFEGNASDERIAAQIVKSDPGGAPWRLAPLRRAADRALARGAPAAAVAWLTRALAESPAPAERPDVLLELGVAELRQGMPEALDHLRDAVTGLPPSARLATAARQLANAYSMTGNVAAALSSLESAIAILEPHDRELALTLDAELAAKSQQAGDHARETAATRLAKRRSLEGVTPGERLVLASLAFEDARGCESEREAVRCIERGLAGVGLFGQQPDVVGPFYALVIALLGTDALELAHTTLEQALAEARARCSIPATAFLTAHRGWFHLRGGDLALAEADARTAFDLMTAHDIRLGRQFALALLVEALLGKGQVEAARDAMRTHAPGSGVPPGLANDRLLEARGLLRIALGDTRAGLEDLLEFGRRDEQAGAANALASRWRPPACLALRAADDTEAARRLIAEELERARRWGAASGIGVAMRVAALIDHDQPAVVDRLGEAASLLQTSPAKLDYAHALVDLGAAQRRANRRAEARVALEQGLKLARRCGADALAGRADVELRAAGGRSSDPAKRGFEQLTASERRVAELAARGQNNPQIAQALFVTRKTVETHLGHIYAKLEIAGRADLARALAKHTED
jgi:DNA-binding NarL/FixJ family response regulator/tetratricopeptide (TPR) repeat protein